MHLTRVNLGGFCDVVVCDSRVDRNVRARIRDNAPHSHYALGREDIARELSAFRKVCAHLAPRIQCGSVLELFGGSGWHSKFIQNYLTPRAHVIIDQSADCVASIRENAPRARVIQGDSTRAFEIQGLLDAESMSEPDWIHADFNDLRPGAMSGDLRVLLVWLMTCKNHSYITITDSSASEDPGSNPTHSGAWLGALTNRKLEASWSWGPATMHLFMPKTEESKERGKLPPKLHLINEPMLVRILSEKYEP